MIGSMFAINGEWQPSPAGVEVTYSVLDKYAERSESGQINREIAAKKIKYVLNWPYIPDRAEFTALWNKLASLPEYAMFTLPNPDGTMHTFQGYVGADLGVTMLSYWDMGRGREGCWKSLKASIIER